MTILKKYLYTTVANKRHRNLINFIILNFVFLIFTACPDWNDNDDNDDNDIYDPRNVTRIDNHLEVQPDLVLDSKGNVHMIYFGSDDYYTGIAEVYYIWRNQSGEWSDPVNLSNSSNDSRVPQIAIDSQDNIHVIWEEDNDGNGRTMYTMKQEDADWSEPIFITDSYNLLPQISVDSYDNLHVCGDGFRLQYLRNEGGIWLPMENPDTISILNPSMSVSKDGDVFIGAEGGNMIELVSRLESTGLWSREFITDSHAYPWVASVAVGENETVYISWTVRYADQIKISTRYPDGTWSEIDSIPNMEGDPWKSKLAVDEYGLHAIWNAHTDEWDYDIYYQMRTHGGEWKERQQISLTHTPSLDPAIYLKDNVLYITWIEILGETKRDNIDVYYQTVDITQ